MTQLEVLEASALARGPVRHAFFTRKGGVSTGIFAALNCGFGSADTPEAVTENRTRASNALAVASESLCSLYQVHSAKVVTLDRPWARDDRPQADAMVTRESGIALGILTADCVPVLFADAEASVIGAAHAGWKGALGGVLEATLDAMQALGAERGRIAAALGPSIAQASYEVGPEFHAAFEKADPANTRFFVPSDREAHWRFDLQAYVTDRLAKAGIAASREAAIDTYASEELCFSYRRTTHRRESDYGRLLSAITLAR
jgi:purine-nucleoside/S-methyl-5'-thioadenosine phosphorylase / adenosine deaminase